MGAAPSRETHRRGLFAVQQGNAPAMSSKKQDIVLVPLTREYFPSPDCPLFVQFHKARCDAAVNYYFRRPGDPGDLSSIPHYAGAYHLSEERLRRRRASAAKRKGPLPSSTDGEGGATRATTACPPEPSAAPAPPVPNEGCASTGTGGGDGAVVEKVELIDISLVNLEPAPASDPGATKAAAGGATAEGSAAAAAEDEGVSEEDEESMSFPSREALYRGVIDHIEDILFDTDEEMREAYALACANPDATVGPDGRKLRKVLPVLCAVAFRMDAGKVAGVGLGEAAAASGGSAGAPAGPPASQQIAVEAGVYLQGSILNIVGCFGFASMQDEVDAMQEQLQMQQRHGPVSPTSPAMRSGMMGSRTAAAGAQRTRFPFGAVGGGSQPSSNNSSMYLPVAAKNFSLGSSVVNGSAVDAAHAGGGPAGHRPPGGTAADLMTLPYPIAAPLAALVFLTKSAGEQNLGRVTHIAATTYYYQLIQAGVIQRRGPEMYTAAMPPPPPSSTYPSQGAAPGYYGPTPPHHPPPPPPPPPSLPHAAGTSYGGSAGGGVPPYGAYGYRTATYPPTSPVTSMPELFQPPMETFSFSSLMTNIPILSFLYEMKCRWGYLGVLKGHPPTANSSFASSSLHSFPSPAGGPRGSAGRRPGTMMGNHSTGGLSAIDPYSGENVTDEMEMWITPDHMLHGRVSRDLASRLCLSLAERPEVMQERVLQLPSVEEGYWRYKGLVSRARPPPVPAPGRLVSIHPKDVYVMGSDVLPGFDEGDILRFDPERLVWFADHSIPLEGVVLAAMRPHCKCAREAESTDAGWVTRLVPAEEVAYLREKGETFFPTPPASVEQVAEMAKDPTLQRVHEHVGNFYVYRFERDGAAYYHGTIPNFANPNKRKAAAGGCGVADVPTGKAPITSPVVASGGAIATTTTAAATASAEKPPMQVPRTIAGALFSLFPAGTTAAGTPTTADPATTGTRAGLWGSHPTPPTAPPPARQPSTTAAASTTSRPIVSEDTPAYLRGRVTSTAIEAARTLMRNLYSYAYGAPMRAPVPGDSTTAAATATTAPAPPARTPLGGGVQRGGGSGGVAGATASTGTYPTVSPARPGLATAGGTAVSPVTVMAPTTASLSGVGPALAAGNGGGGMYPRSRRPPSSAARSSGTGSPAVRHVNPMATATLAAAAGSYLPSPVQPGASREAYWPSSPTFTPDVNAVGFDTRSPAGSARGSYGYGYQPANVHVHVPARGLGSPLLPVSLASGRAGEEGALRQAIPPSGSQSDLIAASSSVVMQPSTQVRRYKEGGHYVWDWRLGSASVVSGGGGGGGGGGVSGNLSTGPDGNPVSPSSIIHT